MYLEKLRNMGRKQHSLLLQSCVKWDVKFREQGMLNDHPRRCFHKITLKNWRMLCYISSVRATLHILRQLSQVRSGQLLQESKSAHWFQLSRQLWAKKLQKDQRLMLHPQLWSAGKRCHIGHPEGQSLPHRDWFHNSFCF